MHAETSLQEAATQLGQDLGEPPRGSDVAEYVGGRSYASAHGTTNDGRNIAHALAEDMLSPSPR